MSSVAVSENESQATPQTDVPRGWLGRVTGWMMKRLNHKLTRITIQQMKLNSAVHVLEVGCGAGEALRIVLNQTTCLRAAGIDCSQEMIDESIKTNQVAFAAGSLELQLGQVEKLPWKDECFSQVFAISNFHIWNSRSAGLQEILRVLQSKGRFLLCLRRARATPRWFDQPGVTEQELTEDMALIRAAGFIDVQLLEIPSRQPILLLSATKPSGRWVGNARNKTCP